MSAASPGALGAGDRLGKWEIEQALAPGASPTYLAHHVEDRSRQALIRVLPKSQDAAATAKRQMRILKAIEHPAAPKYLDLGFSPQEGVWIATEHFQGTPLDELVRFEPPDWKQACRLFHPIAQVLAELHASGFVHQSIRADRILVGRDGAVQLADFSEAAEAAELERASTPKDFGPLAYAAPELARQARSARSDVYALGVMFYETLTQRSAFPVMITPDRAAALRFLDYKRKEAPPLDPGADLPGWLRDIVRKATMPDPEQRLADAETFAMFLDATRDQWQADASAPRRAFSEAPPSLPPMAAPDLPPAAPPVLMLVRPSLAAPPVPVLVPANSPELVAPETPLVPVAYAAAAALGVVTGIAAGVLLIGSIDAAYVNVRADAMPVAPAP